MNESLLCEYKGVIKIIKKEEDSNEEYFEIEKDDKNNIYGLFSTHFANEGRYISGIPNQHKEKANCGTITLIVDKIPRTFVFSIKRIMPGEILYINYGSEYPT
jgi:hypothetical protein